VKELKISIKLSDIQKEFKMKNTYPVTVQEWLDNLYGYLKTKDFFEGEELEDSDEENVMSSFYDIVGKAALQSWLENGDIRIEEEELTKLLYQVVIKVHVEELRKSGMVDSIEDENGEEVVWLTPKGKDIRKKL
jgi:hypothetical protein